MYMFSDPNDFSNLLDLPETAQSSKKEKVQDLPTKKNNENLTTSEDEIKQELLVETTPLPNSPPEEKDEQSQVKI